MAPSLSTAGRTKSPKPGLKSPKRSPRIGVKKPIAKSTENENPNDAIRNRVKEMFAAALYKESEGLLESKEKAMELAVTIEKEMVGFYKGTTTEYKDKFRSLNFNLKDDKNSRLRSLVVEGIVTPSRLLTMTSLEMANPERQEENTKIDKKNLADARVYNPREHAATTDLFKCGKCKQRKCTYYQMQTRSADEPLTTFVSCMHCGNRWKC